MSVTRILCEGGCGFPIAFCKCPENSPSLHTDIKKYLDQLAPHVKNREAARLLQRVVSVCNDLCEECGHDMKYHTRYGCTGAFPNGTDGLSSQEVFCRDCHCPVKQAT